MTGLLAVLHPVAFALGFGAFLILLNNTTWYLPLFGWCYAFSASLYLLSKGYRELMEFGFDILLLTVKEIDNG
jgi:hypothetical protein